MCEVFEKAKVDVKQQVIISYHNKIYTLPTSDYNTIPIIISQLVLGLINFWDDSVVLFTIILVVLGKNLPSLSVTYF